MPFPWKNHTISRFIADLRSPTECDGSFIADTGFPASLVDLFVKSRDRLRKSFAEKQTQIPRRRIAPPPTEAPAALPRPKKRRSGADRDCDNVLTGELSGKSVIAVVVKSFVVVALGLSTKNLVVGITFSAIVLLLLEFVGKRVDIDLDLGLWLKPFSNTCKSSIRRGMSIFHPQKPPRRLQKCHRLKIDACYESLDTQFEEEVESDPVVAENCNEEGGEGPIFYGRRHRIRAKIIKRLQALKRNKKEEEESRDCEKHELGLDSNQSSDESRTSWFCGSSPVTTAVGGRGGKVDSGCLVMVLIVLVGLVDGRIWAFVLTLVWCLVLQFVGDPCAYKNVPVIKSLISMGR